MKTVFQLQICYLKDHCRMKEHGFVRPVSIVNKGYFSSLRKAENYMHQRIDHICDNRIFAFFINEKVVVGNQHTHFATMSRYSYTPDGKLNDYSDVANDSKARYFGRNLERIHFHRGDIVEAVCRDEIILCIVAATPLTEDDCQKRLAKCKERLRLWLHREPTHREIAIEYPLDDTDDTYRILEHYGDGFHEHLSPVNLFKPTRKITKAQREHLLSQMFEKNE
jgi:hypothetical protein